MQQLKEKLVPLSNIPTDRQRLIFRGAVLQDTQRLISARESLIGISLTAFQAHAESFIQAMCFADIEDGHTLHLVERPEGVPPSAAAQGAQQQAGTRTETRRINIGMIDANGAMAAAGVSTPTAAHSSTSLAPWNLGLAQTLRQDPASIAPEGL